MAQGRHGMPAQQTVLVVGATGRTGRLVVEQLVSRGVAARVIVRSADRLPATLAADARVTVIVADLLALPDAALEFHVRGCDAIVSCLGHVISFRGIFGPPRDLVTRATERICCAAQRLPHDRPVRVVLMSSVSVNHPGRREPRRSGFERALLWLIRTLIPPSEDNQRAADFLAGAFAPDSPDVQWTAVRPDTLITGEVSAYDVHETIVNSLFKPANSTMSNVAHFMSELVTNDDTWHAWRGRLPVIVNATRPTRVD